MIKPPAVDEVRAISDHLFRLAMEAAPTGMMMIDQEGRIVLANAQVERLFGYARDELIGEPIEMLVPARVRAGHPELRFGFYENPHPRAMAGNRDLYGLRKDGSEVPIEIRLNPLITPDGAFVLSSIVDITERKRAAAQLEASLREKETLLKEVHHRVKNNLQVISSLLSLQAAHVDDPRLGELLQDSQNRVDSIALVHDQLSQAPDLARVDLSEYLRTLVEHLESLVPTGGTNVTIDVRAANLELPLDAAVPCGLIVNELVTNALKHAFRGRPAGVIRIVANADGRETRVSISDDGVGLPPGFALERSTSMGLRLVTTLARQLGATMRVEQSGGGTEFRMSFEVAS